MEIKTIGKLTELAAQTVWFDPAVNTEPTNLWVLVRPDWSLFRTQQRIVIFPTYDSACRYLGLIETGRHNIIPTTATPMNVEEYAYQCPPECILREGFL
jgi:hypothetical protein